jgi:hypothetical protein
MKQTEVVQPLLTLKIIWCALNFSMVLYGFALFMTGKEIVFKVPESYSAGEILALCSTMLLFVTYNIHEKKIKSLTSINDRFHLYIKCWALHEGIAGLAFVAVLLGNPGNMLIYTVNFVMAVFGNILTFPKAPIQRV